jgi:protein required for attachment to host cells
MTKTWIVVADNAHARLFTRTGNRGPLTEQKDLLHPESQLHDRDLASDRQGRGFEHSKGGSRHAMDPKTTPHDHAAEVFAKEIVALLETARTNGSMDSLALIAAPHFLGLLRQGLSEQTRRLVVKEVHKDLVRHSVKEIAEHLDALPE